jgi:hypothetical protein
MAPSFGALGRPRKQYSEVRRKKIAFVDDLGFVGADGAQGTRTRSKTRITGECRQDVDGGDALLPSVVVVDPMDQLQRLVLGDAALCQTLLAITERREFVLTVAAVARQHGVPLDPAAIDDALVAARRSQSEYWV